METAKRIFITIGSGIVSFMFLFIWTIIFCITGVLMLIDWIHQVWTGRRISWIKNVMNGWSELFDHPFTKKAE